MATSRVVNTNFWKDNYIADLDPIEKLLFMYFITNPRTTLAGVYEINIREVAFDTGIDKDMVLKILERFCVDGKMYFENNWLCLNNFIKHQRLNPSIILGIKKAINELPNWLQQKIDIENLESSQLSIFISVNEQSGYSLGTVTPQRKEKKRKEIKLKEKKTNMAIKSPSDEISVLYYEIIKEFALPVRNHNNVKNAISKLRREDTVDSILAYLHFLKNDYKKLVLDHKPELSEALDIHAKRKQIENCMNRTISKQSIAGRRNAVAL